MTKYNFLENNPINKLLSDLQLFLYKNDNISTRLVNDLQSITNDVIQTESIEVATEVNKAYKKLGETTAREFLDPVFVNNAGLIILAPYLGMLFERCGLMEKSKFKSVHDLNRAVKLLEYAAIGEQNSEEHQLVMHKVLCGLHPTYVLEPVDDLTETDKEIVDGLLHAVTQQWAPLKSSSIDSLRSSFLAREGWKASLQFLKVTGLMRNRSRKSY